MADERFWVFFDTATRQDYIEDVHKVLGEPEGALIEYQYSDGRMDAEVVAATQAPLKAAPRQVLFVYAQWTDYHRGADDPTGPKPPADMRYQAMRFGELVAMWRDGERAVFQFRLGGRPLADPVLLAPIIDALAERSAVPYDRWVAFSSDASSLQSLASPDPVKSWQETVERLLTPPMQFSEDSFIRVGPPRRNRFWTPSALGSRYPAREGHAHALDHVYVVPERCRFTVTVATHAPSGSTRGGDAEDGANYEVAVQKSGPILGPEPNSGHLRRTADTVLRFETRHSAETEQKTGSVTIRSGDASPHGVGFVFQLRLAAWKRLLGVCMGLVGLVLAFLCATLTNAGKISFGLSLGMGLGALLLIAGGTFLYTGKWDFKT